MPVATLPLLNSKIYVVWDTSLVQSVFRNKNLSIVPFAREFTTNELSLVGNVFLLLYTTITAEHLRKMSVSALRYISDQLNTSFNGSKTFEALLILLLINILLKLTTPAVVNACGRLQAALSKYYGADKDKSEGTSELRIREEVERVIKHNGTEVVFDVSRFDNECPLLISCYRETLRLSSYSVNVCRVEEDTTITDTGGVLYTLKKGCDDVWGDSPRSFDPERFLATSTSGSKTQEKYLYPGRNFALIENLGYVAALVVGFETQPSSGESASWQPLEMVLGNGDSFGVRIRRRAGWEKVRVAFKC
ncbi:hypothetical protein B0T11DRAFT_307130 [Plectosphaerella cucumerina]|uniref:Uncharacterized protein n=1 Tax=Plectosphaerella cucumerina TaxID=40658 RepID=A0A8K0TFY6_9PEZI|nr:hypothetical protein B0T11DRAFT_307130 [Plectosphaerella cucumerina]